MRKFLFLPLLSLLASCAKDDDCSPANVNPDNLVSPALYATLEQHSTDPYTGPLEVLPCQPDGSIYVGNYTPKMCIRDSKSSGLVSIGCVFLTCCNHCSCLLYTSRCV